MLYVTYIQSVSLGLRMHMEVAPINITIQNETRKYAENEHIWYWHDDFAG